MTKCFISFKMVEKRRWNANYANVEKEGWKMLYLVRHGQTKYNVELRIQGTYDSPLTEQGISDAQKLALRLKDIPFAKVYASKLGRAIQTANILKTDESQEVLKLEGLNEMCFGVLECKRKEDLQGEELENYNNFFHAPEKYKAVEGGQTYEEMFEVVRETAEKLFAQAKDKDILAVSHGIWIKVFYCIMKNRDVRHVWNPPFIGNTALTVIDCSGTTPKIVLEGDMSHLEE